MSVSLLPRWLVPRLPFYYGWVVLVCACCAGMSRQGGAVGTLSVFITPMTTEFGWSRTAISGAVSLGGVLAALSSPFLGRLLDRAGARLLLCAAVLTTGVADLALSLTVSLPMFYLLFCVARLNFAGPFELGIYGAVNNWFVARRAFASSIATVAQMAGLVLLPVAGALATLSGGWRDGWLAVGAIVLVVGFIPAFLFLVRAPEDVGLRPDGGTPSLARATRAIRPEPAFSRTQAVRTRAFWMLVGFTMLAYPAQSGISLHQAPLLIERGLSPAVAASIVGYFSLVSGAASFAFGLLPRRVTARWKLAITGLSLCLGAVVYCSVHGLALTYVAATFFGAGVGGLLINLPVAWADYFGRRSYGAIRGIALTAQVIGQGSGPLISGLVRDLTGGYTAALAGFAALAGVSVLVALLARPPGGDG